MSNLPFEPKDGDYVSLIQRLGKTTIDEIKDEIQKSQKEHQHHSGELQSQSIERNINNNNKEKSPYTTASDTHSNSSSSRRVIGKEDADRAKFVFFFIAFAFFIVVVSTFSLADRIEDPDEMIFIFMPGFIFFIIIFAMVKKAKNKYEKKK